MPTIVAPHLPPEINSRVRIQYADDDGFRNLCWHGFCPETVKVGGDITMRRDFQDGTWANVPEPPPPKFRVVRVP